MYVWEWVGVLLRSIGCVTVVSRLGGNYREREEADFIQNPKCTRPFLTRWAMQRLSARASERASERDRERTEERGEAMEWLRARETDRQRQRHREGWAVQKSRCDKWGC